MEGLTTPLYGSLKRCKKRSQYTRLESVGSSRNEVQMQRIEEKGQKYCWKINAIPKSQLAPVKALKKFRDAYVDMMLSFAGNVAQLNYGNIFFCQGYSKASTDLSFSGDLTSTRKLRGGLDGIPPPTPPNSRRNAAFPTSPSATSTLSSLKFSGPKHL